MNDSTDEVDVVNPFHLTEEQREEIYKIAYATGEGSSGAPVKCYSDGSYEWTFGALYRGQAYVVNARFTLRNDRVFCKIRPRYHETEYLTAEELTPSPEDVAFAQSCIDEGFMQVSSKNRRLARMPPDIDPVEAMRRFAPEEFEKIVHAATWWVRRNMKDPEHMRELTLKQFRAFKKLGGGVG
jgi:hypothetical protein